LPDDEKWRREALRRTLKYKNNVDDLKRRGTHMSKVELEEMEEWVDRVRRKGMSLNEHVAHERKLDVAVEFGGVDWVGRRKNKSRRESRRDSVDDGVSMRGGRGDV
jgi:hypothetical protein